MTQTLIHVATKLPQTEQARHKNINYSSIADRHKYYFVQSQFWLYVYNLEKLDLLMFTIKVTITRNTTLFYYVIYYFI